MVIFITFSVLFSTIDCTFEFLVKFPFGNMLQLSKICHLKIRVFMGLTCKHDRLKPAITKS